MKIKLLISFAVGLLISQTVFSQNEPDSDTSRFNKSYVLQGSVTSFFERYNSVDVSLYKNLGNRAIGVQLGYIFDINGFYAEIEDDWFKDVNGVKAFFQYRFYFGKEQQYPAYSSTFFEIQPALYFINFNSERIIGYDCNEEFGDCEYYRYFDSEISRLLPAIYLNIGKVYDFNPLVITVSGGLGVRHVFDMSDIPKSPEPDKFFFTNGEMSDIASGTQFNVRVGVLVGYKF